MNIARIAAITTLALVPSSVVLAHITIWPRESTQGARERYTMRVPNEKQFNCVRIEGEFPPELKVYDFEFKPGWKIDFKKDDKGNIIGANWTGTLAPYEFIEFGMLGINPKEGTSTLVWKFWQYYEGGTKEEFIGPVGSFYPSPVVTLKAPPPPASTK